ncbi:hypothetical protein JCM3775_006713 [Rhodotorula graminis]
MTESNAFLAYGITVTTESLLYAVAAWPRLQGPFAFIDLVALRKLKGKLVVAPSQDMSQSAIEQIPLEIWGVVRHNVVDLELREAEVEHVEHYTCSCFKGQGLKAEDLSWNDTVAACSDFPPGNVQDGLLMNRYLNSMYLLCTSNATQTAPPESPFPSRQKPVYIPPVLPEPADAPIAALHLVFRDVPPVPPDAAQRFHRLVSTMHLQPVDTSSIVTSEFILCRPGRSPSESAGEKREFKKVGPEDMGPRWTIAPLWPVRE